jgi:hypothetical protein
MAAPTLIRAFAVDRTADAELLAWHADAGAGSLFLRALRDDVELRFVELAAPGAADAPFPAYASEYEVVHEDGDPDGAGGALLIDPFEVPGDADAAFLDACARVRGRFAVRRGYIGSRVYRGADAATFRFVHLVHWSSPLMFARALDDAAVGDALAALPFDSRPALYMVAQR